MSLFSSIQMANNTLRAQQIGLQVTGQNIANANTPGYIREEVVFKAAPTQRLGNLLLGMGVEVSAIIQKSDKFLELRYLGAVSDQSSADVQEQTLSQLESLFGELGDTDISTSLNNFFNSISEVLNQPESDASRNLAVLRGRTLASDLNRISSRVGEMRDDLNSRVEDGIDSANRLLEEIRQLNIKIANTEGGSISRSDAVGLRDQRSQAVNSLAKLINIDVKEQDSGAISIYSGGDYLVIDGSSRKLTVEAVTDRGVSVLQPRVAETDFPLEFTGGEIAGLIQSRDAVLGSFNDQLDEFAGALTFEFNKIFSSGQGLKGYTSLTSVDAVTDPTAALDDAGLNFRPSNGSFDVLIYNVNTKQTQTTNIQVDLNGINGDTSLQDLASALDAISGLKASINTSGNLILASESSEQQFSFGNDTSGVLAALGVNTFFTGSTARDIGINAEIVKDPAKFAASAGGIGEDTAIGVKLAAFQDKALGTQNGASIGDLYGRIASNLTQDSAIAKSIAEGARVFADNLSGQALAVSGVNIDEEALNMLRFQRVYQASARYIQTLDELLQILVTL